MTKNLIVGIFLLILSYPVSAADKITAEVLNFSDMDRWVRITDMICDTVLWKDNLDAQRRLPVELCAGDDGKAKVQLYIRIGCTRNKTILKNDVENGMTIQF